MVNLTDVLISSGDGEDRGDRREMAPARGLCSAAAASASPWLPGEGLALVWVPLVLEPGFRVWSVKLFGPLTLFVPHTIWTGGGWDDQLPLLQMDKLRPNTPQNPYDVGRARWNEEASFQGAGGWPWFCFFARAGR